jgi:hypothetical protein
MERILLQSASGKWKYRTTTDDPVFAPLFDSMKDAGLTLSGTLIIPGALGEELEKNWGYVEVLRVWDVWEKGMDNYTKKDVVPPNRNTSSYGALASMYPIPDKIVRYKDVEVLSRALALPDGWYSHTIIDETAPLHERIYHMKASFSYLRKYHFGNTLAEWDMDEMGRKIVNDAREYESEATVDGEPYYASLLAPFVRNVWLNDPNRLLPLPYLISRIDFPALYGYLQPYAMIAKEKLMYVIYLVQSVLGKIDYPVINYGFDIVLYPDMLGFDRSKKKSDLGDNIVLRDLYTKMLNYMPLDVHPENLGLESIVDKLLGPDNRYVRTQQYVTLRERIEAAQRLMEGKLHPHIPVSDYVGWVNSNIIASRQGHDTGYLAPVSIGKKGFPLVITHLSETVGLHAMRRILLSLLHFLNKEENSRVEEFTALLEKYLEEHEGENEDIVILKIY